MDEVSPIPLCPECRDGKHYNCVNEALNSLDVIVPCGCGVCHPAPMP